MPNSNEDLSNAISPIEEVIADFRNGRMVVLVDAEDRENEGDLVIPAQMATPDAVNFMAKHGRGLICLAMTRERGEDLSLEYMARDNRSRNKTAFTVSIEAKEGISTGISAHDRARTISVAIDPTKSADDIVSPGHVFPLIASDGGVLVRAGHTEAAVDLARLAGLTPAGVICEIMNDDGTMARLPELVAFAREHDLKVATIADLIAYRYRYDRIVAKITEQEVESAFGGSFRMHIYRNRIDGAEHVAFVKGQVSSDDAVLVRVHAVNLFTDMFGVGNDGHARSLVQKSLDAVNKEGCGVVVVIRDVGKEALSRHLSQITGDSERADVDGRRVVDIGVGSQILQDLGVQKMILLSNSQSPRYVGLGGYGLEIIGQRSID